MGVLSPATYNQTRARVLELEYRIGSKPIARQGLWVRIPPRVSRGGSAGQAPANRVDDASTSEIAEEMADAKKPANPVRFAFWGAEESGLLGSEHYVGSLTDAELAKIGLNLNFDMLASPNYVRFVYDGDGSDTGTAGPAGSDAIEATFTSYFASKGLATVPTAFDGRSDYGPFIAVGIPAGGLFSGAEGLKTPERAAVFGGVAGAAYDACYHQACDTIANINPTGLEELADGAAHATAVYAYARSGEGASAHQKEGPRKGDAFQR